MTTAPASKQLRLRRLRAAAEGVDQRLAEEGFLPVAHRGDAVEIGRLLRLRLGDGEKNVSRREHRGIDLEVFGDLVARLLHPIDTSFELAIAKPRLRFALLRQL